MCGSVTFNSSHDLCVAFEWRGGRVCVCVKEREREREREMTCYNFTFVWLHAHDLCGRVVIFIRRICTSFKPAE